MNLWLDDLRVAPPGWTWAKTVDEAVKLVLSQVQAEDPIVYMSLDHDLGHAPDCPGCAEEHLEHIDSTNGTKFVIWMCQDDSRWPVCRPMVHSMNPVGAERMRALIDRYGPYEK